MHGFIKLIFLTIILAGLGFLAFYGYLNYQKYKNAKLVIDALPRIDQTFNALDTFQPDRPTAFLPGRTLNEGVVTYSSPFTPCLELIEDRRWLIYASQKNLLPGYTTKMYFDRFWQTVWLALLPEDENQKTLFTFYGPFLLEDLPERSFVEYILIGKDVLGDTGLISINSDEACKPKNNKIIEVKSTL